MLPEITPLKLIVRARDFWLRNCVQIHKKKKNHTYFSLSSKSKTLGEGIREIHRTCQDNNDNEPRNYKQNRAKIVEYTECFFDQESAIIYRFSGKLVFVFSQ